MLEIDIKLLPFQGVTNERALPQGVASLALGYALHWAFSPPLLNPKLQFYSTSGHANPSLCIGRIFPLRTDKCVSCERSAPNLVIITLKSRLFRFYLKTFPSTTGLW